MTQAAGVVHRSIACPARPKRILLVAAAGLCRRRHGRIGRDHAVEACWWDMTTTTGLSSRRRHRGSDTLVGVDIEKTRVGRMQHCRWNGRFGQYVSDGRRA